MIGYTARELATLYKDELREGIAWLAIYKIGRRYMAHAFWLESNDMPSDEDIEDLKKILFVDKNAVVINGYYNAPFAYDTPINFLSSRIIYNYKHQIDKLSGYVFDDVNVFCN